MKSKDFLAALGVGAIAVAVTGFAVGSTVKKISFQLTGVTFDFNQIAAGKIGLNINFSLKNDNDFGAIVTNIEGRIFYGTLKVGDVLIPSPISIPANGLINSTIVLEITAITLVADIISLFSNGATYAELVNPLNFKGTIYTNVVNIPLDFNIPVTIG